MTPQEILQKAAKTLEERGGTYGDYMESLGRVGLFLGVYMQKTVNPADAAIMLALMKIARMRASPMHADNYIDACGYLALAGGLTGAPAKD